jgi:thiamine-phosphate pyrophosphorylase
MASGSQLYLSVPAGFSGAPSIIEEALLAARAPSLLITGKAELPHLRMLRDAAHRQNAAVLIENDYAVAKAEDLDGVHLRVDGSQVREAREVLGPDRIVGADCTLSRHAALTLAEAGADYIAFGRDESGEVGLDALVEMIGWWSDLLEIPCVAHLPANATGDEWRKVVAAGADFVIPGAGLWDEPGAVRDNIRLLARLCEGGAAPAIS